MSTSRKLLFVFLLALVVRLTCWQIIDTVYRDTTGFILNSAHITSESLLRDKIQEPVHLLLVHGFHALLFPHHSAFCPYEWELAIFTVGMAFTFTTLFLLFLIGKHLHSSAAGIWAAFFFALLPYAVRYSINGLSEIPFLTFLLLTIYLVLKSPSSSVAFLIPAGISAAILFLSRKEGIVLVPAIFAYFLFFNRISLSRRICQSLLFTAGMVAVLGLYWGLGGRFHWFLAFNVDWVQNVKNLFIAAAGDGNTILAFTWLSGSHQLLSLPLLAWFKLSGFLPAILFILYLIRRPRLSLAEGSPLIALYLFFHLALVIFFSYGTKMFVTRYIFPAAVIILPISAAVLVELITRYRARVNPIKAQALLATFLVLIFTLESISNAWRERRPEIPSAVQWIQAHTPANAFIFTNDDRIGFYCPRPWQFNAYLLQNSLHTIPHLDSGRLYVAAYYSKNENKLASEWQQNIRTEGLYKLELQKIFYLREKPSSFTGLYHSIPLHQPQQLDKTVFHL